MNYAARVRCECGRFRVVSSDWMGNTIEECACGVRSFIRGNPPTADSAVAVYDEVRASTLPRCAWEGCDQHTNSARTDFCPRHCEMQKKMRDRARYQGKPNNLPRRVA